MEPDVKAFLIRIVQSLSMALVWLLFNMTVGIFFGLAFFEDRPAWFNFLYYFVFLASLYLLIRYLRNKWKGWEEIHY